MNLRLVERIVNAVLYEGYILYPYRPSSVKNRQRFNFGAVCPEAYSLAQNGTDAWSMQTECLVIGGPNTVLDVKARFLHLLAREVGRPVADSSGEESQRDEEFQVVESLEVGGQLFQTWQEAVERDVSLENLNLNDLVAAPQHLAFTFPAKREIEPLREASGKTVGAIIRNQEFIEGAIELRAEQTPNPQPASGVSQPESLFKISARILNLTKPGDETFRSRDEALMQSLVSTHTILSVRGGEFVSLLEPSEEFREAVFSCRNIGTWPVLVGEHGERDCLLSSPIILYDYPEIAPESAGDLFDGTEIDEILTLRIMTLTDEEKREMRGVDERARQILERTETLPVEQMMKLHGVMRSPHPSKEDER
jgi:hydrogenase maturation protease